MSADKKVASDVLFFFQERFNVSESFFYDRLVKEDRRTPSRPNDPRGGGGGGGVGVSGGKTRTTSVSGWAQSTTSQLDRRKRYLSWGDEDPGPPAGQGESGRYDVRRWRPCVFVPLFCVFRVQSLRFCVSLSLLCVRASAGARTCALWESGWHFSHHFIFLLQGPQVVRFILICRFVIKLAGNSICCLTFMANFYPPHHLGESVLYLD